MNTRPKPVAALPTNQGRLDFGAPSFAPRSYLHSPQNEAVRAKLDTWQTWPGGVLCVFGEAGSGKSHLGHMWAHLANAPTMNGVDFDLVALAALPSLTVMIDDANLCHEAALFSLLTAVEAKGGAVLLTARMPPQLWPFALPDLQSRLKALVCEALTAPEPELLAQLIVRHSAARGFKIDEAASTFLSLRIPRTFEATRAIVACMEDVTRSSLKSPMALAQRALHAMNTANGYEDDAATPDLFND